MISSGLKTWSYFRVKSVLFLCSDTIHLNGEWFNPGWGSPRVSRVSWPGRESWNLWTKVVAQVWNFQISPTFQLNSNLTIFSDINCTYLNDLSDQLKSDHPSDDQCRELFSLGQLCNQGKIRHIQHCLTISWYLQEQYQHHARHISATENFNQSLPHTYRQLSLQTPLVKF